MFVPEPVIRMAIEPPDRDGADRLSKALHRFCREDPTLHVTTDDETGETIIAGMGELHLEIYVERIRREYNVDVKVGPPKVNYREAPTQPAKFNVRHKKQTGGSGQFAHIVGRFELLPEDAEEPFVFEEQVVGGRIPRQFIPAIEKGFRRVLAKGPDGRIPGRRAARDRRGRLVPRGRQLRPGVPDLRQTAMRETFPKTRPVLLGAGDEDRDRVSQPVPGLGGGRPDLPPRHDHGHGDAGPGRADRGRGAAGRDLRLLDRPAEHDAGPRHLHAGVRPLQAVPPRSSGR